MFGCWPMFASGLYPIGGLVCAIVCSLSLESERLEKREPIRWGSSTRRRHRRERLWCLEEGLRRWRRLVEDPHRIEGTLHVPAERIVHLGHQTAQHRLSPAAASHPGHPCIPNARRNARRSSCGGGGTAGRCGRGVSCCVVPPPRRPPAICVPLCNTLRIGSFSRRKVFVDWSGCDQNPVLLEGLAVVPAAGGRVVDGVAGAIWGVISAVTVTGDVAPLAPAVIASAPGAPADSSGAGPAASGVESPDASVPASGPAAARSGVAAPAPPAAPSPVAPAAAGAAVARP